MNVNECTRRMEVLNWKETKRKDLKYGLVAVRGEGVILEIKITMMAKKNEQERNSCNILK